MARKIHPDHAGRMPDHPRYGNPSDPAEEESRLQGALKNVQDWQDKYGGQFSGGVTMSYGGENSAGKSYHVPIGDAKLADKISSRPLTPPIEAKALPEPMPSAPEPIPAQLPPQQSVLSWLLSKIKERFK